MNQASNAGAATRLDNLTVKEWLQIARNLRALAMQAARNGNVFALKLLVAEATAWNCAVDDVSDKQLKLTMEITPDLEVWPANIAGHRAAIDRAILKARKLRVGSRRPGMFQSKPHRGRKRADSPVQEISMEMRNWLVKARSWAVTENTNPLIKEAQGCLPLTQTTFTSSFEVAWRAFEETRENSDVLTDPRAQSIYGKKPRTSRSKPGGYVKDQVRKASAWWFSDDHLTTSVRGN